MHARNRRHLASRADYHGAFVNMAARFMDAAAHGGQVACVESLAVKVLSGFEGWAASQAKAAGGRSLVPLDSTASSTASSSSRRRRPVNFDLRATTDQLPSFGDGFGFEPDPSHSMHEPCLFDEPALPPLPNKLPSVAEHDDKGGPENGGLEKSAARRLPSPVAEGRIELPALQHRRPSTLPEEAQQQPRALAALPSQSELPEPEACESPVGAIQRASRHKPGSVPGFSPTDEEVGLRVAAAELQLPGTASTGERLEDGAAPCAPDASSLHGAGSQDLAMSCISEVTMRSEPGLVYTPRIDAGGTSGDADGQGQGAHAAATDGATEAAPKAHRSRPSLELPPGAQLPRPSISAAPTPDGAALASTPEEQGEAVASPPLTWQFPWAELVEEGRWLCMSAKRLGVFR